MVSDLASLTVSLATPILAARDERRVDDRRQHARFVLHERRSGFDRRQRAHRTHVGARFDATLVYLRDNTSALLAVLTLANLLSMIDLMLTWRALRLGAIEANPLMHRLLDWNPTVAGIVKVSLVVAVSGVIWALRRYRLLLKVACLALAVFAAVVVYHLWALSVG